MFESRTDKHTVMILEDRLAILRNTIKRRVQSSEPDSFPGEITQLGESWLSEITSAVAPPTMSPHLFMHALKPSNRGFMCSRYMSYMYYSDCTVILFYGEIS